MHLLVMSPSPAARRLMELFLLRGGYRCRVVRDEDEALSALAHGRFTAAVVDARAGGEDMLLFLGLLHKRHGSTPTLILRNARLELWIGSGQASEPEISVGLGAELPGEAELLRVLGAMIVEQQMRVLRTPVALA